MLAGVCSAGFRTTQLPAPSAGASFPRSHQDWEIPGYDLADNAEWFVEMIRDGVVIDFADRPLLRANATREIAEMIDGQRYVDQA